jgi:hypothetical protein
MYTWISLSLSPAVSFSLGTSVTFLRAKTCLVVVLVIHLAAYFHIIASSRVQSKSVSGLFEREAKHPVC